MTNFTARFAGVATLALAALPLAALATAAHAAPVTVRVADLDLNSPHGQAAFEQRVEQAAKSFCKSERRIVARLAAADAWCVSAVRAEMSEKFAVAAKAQRQSQGVYAAR